METSIQGYHKRDKEDLKFLGGQALLLVTFAINLFSSLAIVLIILRLGLARDTQILKLSPKRDEIVLNQNVVADSVLVPGSGFETGILEADKIVLRSASRLQEEPAELSIDANSIRMRARAFSHAQYGHPSISFTIAKQSDRIEAPNGIYNLRAIRSQMRMKKAHLEDDFRDLDLQSSNSIELSGNLGVSVHSRDIDIESPEAIILTSRSDALVISAGNGLFLPSVQRVQREFQDSDSSTQTDPSSERFNLCLRTDGMLYKSPGLC